MPNHVKNVLTLVGDEEKIKELLEAVKNDEYGIGTIDFEKIIPMPDYIYKGNLGRAEQEKYGMPTATMRAESMLRKRVKTRQ